MCLFLTKDMIKNLVKSKREKSIKFNRKQMILAGRKWDKFRADKEKAIQLFKSLLYSKRRVILIISLMKIRQILPRILINFEEYKIYAE